MIKNFISVSCVACMLCIAFTGCIFSGTDGKYNVSGKFTGGNVVGKPIYLTEFDYVRNQAIHVDTSQISADGTFAFKAHPNGLRIFLLSVDDQLPLILVNDQRNVQLKVIDAGLANADIQGSAATTGLHNFIAGFQAKTLALNNSKNAFDSISVISGSNTVAKTLSQGLSERIIVQKAGILTDVGTFINKTGDPATIYYVLNNLAALVLDINDMMALTQQALGRFKTDGALASLANVSKGAVTDTSYPLLNKPAPELAMPSIDDKPMKISDFRGKYLLVDFWASWCGPCRAENPNVVKVYNKYKDKNFTILGVSLDQNKSLWITAVKDDRLDWSHMSDLKQWGSAAIKAYSIKGVPFNVLLDPGGTIIASNLRGPALERKMDELFKDK